MLAFIGFGDIPDDRRDGDLLIHQEWIEPARFRKAISGFLHFIVEVVVGKSILVDGMGRDAGD